MNILGKITWITEQQGNEEAKGNMSECKLRHKISGEGNSELHEIEIEYSNRDIKKINILGEWEFSEFKEFISNIKLNSV